MSRFQKYPKTGAHYLLHSGAWRESAVEFVRGPEGYVGQVQVHVYTCTRVRYLTAFTFRSYVDTCVDCDTPHCTGTALFTLRSTGEQFVRGFAGVEDGR